MRAHQVGPAASDDLWKGWEGQPPSRAALGPWSVALNSAIAASAAALRGSSQAPLTVSPAIFVPVCDPSAPAKQMMMCTLCSRPHSGKDLKRLRDHHHSRRHQQLLCALFDLDRSVSGSSPRESEEEGAVAISGAVQQPALSRRRHGAVAAATADQGEQAQAGNGSGLATAGSLRALQKTVAKANAADREGSKPFEIVAVAPPNLRKGLNNSLSSQPVGDGLLNGSQGPSALCVRCQICNRDYPSRSCSANQLINHLTTMKHRECAARAKSDAWMTVTHTTSAPDAPNAVVSITNEADEEEEDSASSFAIALAAAEEEAAAAASPAHIMCSAPLVRAARFAVGRVLDRQIDSLIGELRYLVHWSGYSIAEATWEPIENFGPEGMMLVSEFEASCGAGVGVQDSDAPSRLLAPGASYEVGMPLWLLHDEAGETVANAASSATSKRRSAASKDVASAVDASRRWYDRGVSSLYNVLPTVRHVSSLCCAADSGDGDGECEVRDSGHIGGDIGDGGGGGGGGGGCDVENGRGQQPSLLASVDAFIPKCWLPAPVKRFLFINDTHSEHADDAEVHGCGDGEELTSVGMLEALEHAADVCIEFHNEGPRRVAVAQRSGGACSTTELLFLMPSHLLDSLFSDPLHLASFLCQGERDRDELGTARVLHPQVEALLQQQRKLVLAQVDDDPEDIAVRFAFNVAGEGPPGAMNFMTLAQFRLHYPQELINYLMRDALVLET